MKNFVITIFALLGLYLNTSAQTNPEYLRLSNSLQNTTNLNTTATINFPITDKVSVGTLRQSKTSAKLTFSLDLGDYYTKQSSWNFSVTVQFSYQFSGQGAISKTLTVTHDKPAIKIIENVLSAVNSATPSPALTINFSAITIGQIGGGALTGIQADMVNNKIRFVATLEREYAIDVRLAAGGMAAGPFIFSPSISNRLVTFSWQPNGTTVGYPNYELQVLKLENNSDLLSNSSSQINASIDWTRALKIETQNFTPSVSLTMAEGSGYYLWRVRPIGTYFPGGISNYENYGNWSIAPNSGTITLSKSNVQAGAFTHAFYFDDPDDNLNWIYNRVFTEADKVDANNPTPLKSSEGISYANGLLMQKQIQKYNSSEDTRIVSQTVQDYSGRPSLVSIPKPISGGLEGYKIGALTNTTGVVYTAAFFDADSKINDPEQVSSTSYEYYSNVPSSPGAVSNENVPDAQGYPFKRTVFTTDGSGRVSEESAPGKTHALGTIASGRGRTTRILYATPTDDELIHLFGDEAPIAKSVLKTITIDPNNVMSVAYVDKSGKTIATALTSTNSPNLESLTAVAPNLTVTNNISEMYSTGAKLISIKRVSIPNDNTLITIGYENAAFPAASSGCASGNCNFRMRIHITDIDNQSKYVSDVTPTTSLINDFVVSGGAFNFSTIPGWKFVISENNSSSSSPTSIAVSGSNNNQITLNKGSYFIVKEIFPANSLGYADSVANTENIKTRPIIEAIASVMEGVKSEETYTLFTAFMGSLTTMVNDHQSSGPTTTADILLFLGIDASTLPPGWTFPTSSEFSLAPIASNPLNTKENKLTVATGCCGDMQVPFPKFPSCVLCEGSSDPAFQNVVSINTMTLANKNALPNEVTPYGFEDFKTDVSWDAQSDNQKRTLVHDLVEREFINPLKDKMTSEGLDANTDLWRLAPGFSYESLNFMISSMLISQYYTGTAVEHPVGSGDWYMATVLSDGSYTLSSSTLLPNSAAYPYNYDCKALNAAWDVGMSNLFTQETSGSENILDKYNDNDNNPTGGQDEVEDDSNWEDLSRRKKKKIKKALSQELVDHSATEEGVFTEEKQNTFMDITSVFIKVAGPQYAAIIDGSPLPGFISSANDAYPTEYIQSFNSVPHDNSITSILITENTGGLSNTYAPVAFSPTTGVPYIGSCNSSPRNELFYSYILRPEWMFKYFVYNVYENNASGQFLADDNAILPHQVLVDVSRKYNPPLAYLASSITAVSSNTNLCSTPVPATYSVGSTQYTVNGLFHVNWSADERKEFYEQISGMPKCPSRKGLSTAGGKADLYDDMDAGGSVLPTCDTKSNLVANGIADLNRRIAFCDQRRTQIKQNLIAELGQACYDIVSCKSAANHITDREINNIVDLVIDTMKAEVNRVKNKYLEISTSLNTPCGSVATTTLDYSDGLCNLPYCVLQTCKEIVLFDDNTLDINEGRSLAVKYYTDCDQKILDMVESGVFLPYIPPMPGCPTPANSKAWQQTCTTNSNCGPEYEEKTECTNKDFEKYSKTYSVSAQ